MISDFLLWISHRWVVTFQYSHLTVFTFCSWLDLLGFVLEFWISILKISKLLQNYWQRVIYITSFEKHLKSSLDHMYSELLSKFGDISFQEYLSKGISHPVFYGDLVYKLRRVKDTSNFISSGSKIVLKPSDLSSLSAGRSIACPIRMSLYIYFAISYLSSMLYVYRLLWPLRLGWLLCWCLYKEVYFQIFKRVSFWLHGCCGEWEGWARKPG